MKSSQRSLLVVLLTVLTLALASACSPSINPALKSSIDGQLGSLVPSAQNYPAGMAPLGYQTGQWLRYKMLDKDGKPSIMTYRIISGDPGNFAIETENETYYSHSTNYMEIRYNVAAPIDTLEILRVISSTDGERPREASPMELSMMRSMYQTLLSQMFLQQLPAPGGNAISVTAGSFQDCGEMDSRVTIGPWTFDSHSWHHPAVPMHGMVQNKRTDGEAGGMELIAFGLSGAQSTILAQL